MKIFKRMLLVIGAILAVPIVLLLGLILADQIPMSAARPPKNLKTLQDFLAWKKDVFTNHFNFEHEGATYTVRLAPAGRYLPSGPSAYLFDTNGQFIDWTADMGDNYTVKHGFNLTGGVGDDKGNKKQ